MSAAASLRVESLDHRVLTVASIETTGPITPVHFHDPDDNLIEIALPEG